MKFSFKDYKKMPKLATITFFAVLFSIAIAIAVIVGMRTIIANTVNQPLGVAEQTMFTIKPGESLTRVCNRFDEYGWFNDCFYLKIMNKLQPEISKIKSGTYLVKPEQTFKQVLFDFIQGNEHQFSFTIIEGENIYQVIDKLKQTETISYDLVAKEQLASQFESILHDKPDSADIKQLEGWLAPDTYYYTKNTKATSIMTRAILKQQAALRLVWQNRAEGIPIKSAYELLIIASIIEKESALDSEHAKIASVFYNRINKRMRLQTDPTVIYGVWDEYNGDITRAHLKTRTPYNTYRINGLTPTPISNPSLKALKAAATPDSTNFLYFVASGRGGHVFSKTLREHNKALRDYLSLMKKDKE
jgi:UPF0755 protein